MHVNSTDVDNPMHMVPAKKMEYKDETAPPADRGSLVVLRNEILQQLLAVRKIHLGHFMYADLPQYACASR